MDIDKSQHIQTAKGLYCEGEITLSEFESMVEVILSEDISDMGWYKDMAKRFDTNRTIWMHDEYTEPETIPI